MANPIDNPVILFGTTNFRNQVSNFGIKMDDRRKHMYIIGKTGMGKTELLKNIAIQDVQEGRGMCFIDPHGDPVVDLLDYIPEDRVKDVIYFDPSDQEHPIAFNVMEHVDFDTRHLVADGMMAVFKKIWVDQWSARMEYILNYTILALLEAPGSTLLGINRMLAEKEYRKSVVEQVSDPEVKAFWTQEFAKYTDKFASEATAAIQNKIGQFVSNALIRNIVGQPKSSFNIREAMDSNKIILVNISKGRIGEDASRLLGALLITKVQLAAMSRVDIPKPERKDFLLVVDEFQNFATASFANILSEARKFNLSLVVAHQYVAQMEEEVRDAVFGNVGTIISFRVGAEDAELLEKEFAPEFMAMDIVNLNKRQIYLKLMIDGVASRAFSSMTMETIPPLPISTRDQVIEASRAQYSRPRATVEEAIVAWRKPAEPAERPARDAGPRDQAPRPYAHSERPQDRGPRALSPQRSYGGQQSQSRPDNRSSAPRPQPRQEPRRDVPANKPGEMSLSSLAQGQPVDFKGRRVQPKEPQAKLSRADINKEELRRLLQKALNPEKETSEA